MIIIIVFVIAVIIVGYALVNMKQKNITIKGNTLKDLLETVKERYDVDMTISSEKNVENIDILLDTLKIPKPIMQNLSFDNYFQSAKTLISKDMTNKNDDVNMFKRIFTNNILSKISPI